jgi:hypothetical protein
VFCRLEELVSLFEIVHSEIEERRAFISRMLDLQGHNKNVEHVRLEVATRLKDLERIDELIQEEQGGTL